MSYNSSRAALLVFLVSICALALLILFTHTSEAATCPGPDCVEIGKDGGTVSVESDLDILFDMGGGGHVTWRISDPAAKELRQYIDKNFGNNNGEITPAEAQSYTSSLDNLLTNSAAVFHGAKLQSFSLLDRNRGVEDNTENLIGDVNSSKTVEIRFLIEATLSASKDDYSLNDDLFVRSLFDTLKNGPDPKIYVFRGKVDIVHSNYIVSMASYGSFNVDHGRLIRVRAPCFEMYRYSVSYDGGTMGNAKDKAQFSGTGSFDILESSLELFILLVLLSFLMLYFPRRFARSGRKQRIRSFHRAIWGFIALLLIVYLFGAAGIFVWIFTPLTFGCVVGFSYMLYIKGWKGYAKPLSLAESRDLDREEGIVRPESYNKLRPRRSRNKDDYDEEEYPPEEEPPRRRSSKPRYHTDEYYHDGAEDEGGPIEEEQVQKPATPALYDQPARRIQPKVERPVVPPPPKPISVSKPSPSPVAKTEQPRPEPTAPPGPPVAAVKKKIRCAQCKQIFEFELKTKPQKVVCPLCGKVGMIK